MKAAGRKEMTMRIDVHSHVRVRDGRLSVDDCHSLVDAADRLGIDQMWCSAPAPGAMPEPEAIRAGNDAVIEAMRLYPERIRGECFVVPGWYREALDEIDRCLDAGMVGIKLYNQYFINDPAVFPVIEGDRLRHLRARSRRAPDGHADAAVQPKSPTGCTLPTWPSAAQATLIMGHIGEETTSGACRLWWMRPACSPHQRSVIDRA